MNRTDRLLAIVLELQRKGHQRAEDLAATFEVTKRTIYRDIQALSEAGVPIVAITNYGYFLEEDYFLPPLNFTADEALMLALGSEFMAQNFDAQYRAAADSAQRKIDTVLPQKLRTQVQYLKTNISFFAMDTLDEAQLSHLRQLRRAIVDCCTVRLHYSKRYSGEDDNPVREVNPYSLARLSNDWLLMGYCHLRQDLRVFRLGRIDRLTVLEVTFERPTNFKPEWIKLSQSRQLVVKVLFDESVARWVQEVNFYAVVSQESTPQGLLVTLRIRQERDIMQWLLSWGKHVHILEPDSLRLLLLDETQQMAKNFSELPH